MHWATKIWVELATVHVHFLISFRSIRNPTTYTNLLHNSVMSMNPRLITPPQVLSLKKEVYYFQGEWR